MRIGMAFVLVLALSLTLVYWIAHGQAQPAPLPEYRTQVGCYLQLFGVASPAAVESGVQGMIADRAKEGWVTIAVAPYGSTSGVCVLVTFRRG